MSANRDPTPEEQELIDRLMDRQALVKTTEQVSKILDMLWLMVLDVQELQRMHATELRGFREEERGER